MATSTAPRRDVDGRLGSPPIPTGRPEQENLPAASAQSRGAADYGGASLAGVRHFFRHFGEMFVAMIVGMIVLGGLDTAILSAGGTSVQHVMDSAPEAFALVMALNMTVGMTLWMRYRRHSWAMCAEMGGAMFLPAILALVLFWCSVIHTRSVGGVEMGAMLPAMLAVMLYRRTEYSQSVRAGRHPKATPNQAPVAPGEDATAGSR